MPCTKKIVKYFYILYITSAVPAIEMPTNKPCITNAAHYTTTCIWVTIFYLILGTLLIWSELHAVFFIRNMSKVKLVLFAIFSKTSTSTVHYLCLIFRKILIVCFLLSNPHILPVPPRSDIWNHGMVFMLLTAAVLLECFLLAKRSKKHGFLIVSRHQIVSYFFPSD